jgi:TfoX/Sxy family transcriptional regulator of competence genes
MAYSEELAARIRDAIGGRSNVSERKMFGGIAWLVGGNMAVGTLGDALMVRLSHEDADLALTEPHARPMDFTGRPLRGFVKIEAAAIADDSALARWVDAGADHAASLPPK